MRVARWRVSARVHLREGGLAEYAISAHVARRTCSRVGTRAVAHLRASAARRLLQRHTG